MSISQPPVSEQVERKFRSKYNSVFHMGKFGLRKEVQESQAHVPNNGEQTFLFAKTAYALNQSKILPWTNDAKHCYDRFKLEIAQ